MANEMGSQALDGEASELEEGGYLVKRYARLPEDLRNKVLANLLNSLRYGNDYFKLIDKDNYFPAYKVFINRLIDNPKTTFKTAELQDNTVLGWSMFEDKQLHYVFVNNDVRRQGIVKNLMPKEIDSFTHLTNKGINIWLKHYPRAKFEPFI